MRNVMVKGLVLVAVFGVGAAIAQDKPQDKAAAMNGFRAWRAAACDRCHGANQEGLVGPSLIESLKTMTKEDFVKTVRDGRLEKGMVSWSNSKTVMGGR